MSEQRSQTYEQELQALNYAVALLRHSAKRGREIGLPASAESDDRAADQLENLKRRLAAERAADQALVEPERDARRCPHCGFYDGLNHAHTRSVPGVVDVGWRCPSCGHEWGFEVLTDSPPTEPYLPIEGRRDG
jgi:hypothetical protein